MKKRILAVLLSTAMLLSIMPMTALAAVATPADYKVTVEVSTTTDRDATNPMVDVFAGDKVTVKVVVSEAEADFVDGDNFVAANVTLSYDTTNFKMVKSPALNWDDDYENMVDEGETPTGKTQFYNAASSTGGYKLTDGKYILGEFEFEALPGKAAVMKVPFKVKAEGTEAYPNTYVAKEWSAGWSSDAAVPVANDNLTNGYANIRLKEMTASVTAKANLKYEGDNSPKTLVNGGCTAKDNSTGVAITEATIKYAVKTKEETEAESFDASTLEYSTTNPTVTNAGDYVLFYQISKPGFVTVNDKVEVSVAKATATLTWTAEELETVTPGKTDGKGEIVTTDYYKQYASGTTYAKPVAKYTDLTLNTTVEAIVTEVNDGTLSATGNYTFNATINDNYTITNPTKTVLIDGGKIVGYTLENTDEGIEEWYDGAEHIAAKLTEAATKTEGVTIKYSLDGTIWSDEMPTVTEVGKYEVQMKLTKDGYYDDVQKVNFEIKNVEYKVEKTDWVTGWDMVLVYTNDTVPGFKYNGKMMYNLSGLAEKYKYDTTDYTYVYGLVIYGDADITKVVPSNEAANAIDYDGSTDGIQATQPSQYDVNSSKNIDINDLVAVQGIYNVDGLYMNDTQMSVVVRADVNRDKKVNTMDCSQIKLHTGEAIN